MANTPDAYLNPRWLQSFVIVAEELNFTRAAARLGIAQQPLSEQIARLESQLGTPVFNRAKRRISLTDAGRCLYTDASDLLSRLSDARQHALHAARGETGRLTIGCGAYAVESLLSRLLSLFRDQYPGVIIHLFEAHTSDQLAALRRGEIDVAFAICPSQSDDLLIEPISEGGFAVALRADDHIPDGPHLLSHFRDATFVTAPRWLSPGLDEVKTLLFEDAGFVPNIGVIASQISTMLTLVASGSAILLTPAAVATVARNDIAFVPIVSTRRAQLSMVTRRETQNLVILDNMRALVRTLTKSRRETVTGQRMEL